MYLDIIYVNVAKAYLGGTGEFLGVFISVDEGNRKENKYWYSHSDI